ncbi:MAG: hypothetical protein KIH69_003200 [Anaerolineae bacterium]|nr:hypothetical protein [Anaerolineae bacterium]
MKKRSNLDIITQFEQLFHSMAWLEVVYDRDEQDKYYQEITCLKPFAQATTVETIARDLIPAGSHWHQFAGWHSYFGSPIKVAAWAGVAVGVQTTAPHPTRGHYLVYRAYIFPAHMLTEVAAQLSMLALRLPQVEPGRSEAVIQQGLWRTSNIQPAQHGFYERHLLNLAAQHYQSGRPFLFRSLAMSQSEIPNPFPDCGVVVVNPLLSPNRTGVSRARQTNKKGCLFSLPIYLIFVFKLFF